MSSWVSFTCAAEMLGTTKKNTKIGQRRRTENLLGGMLLLGCGVPGRKAHHAKADVFGRGVAVRTRIRRAIRAAAHDLALAVGRNHPLRGISPQIKNEVFFALSLPRESANGLEQRRRARQLFQFFPQACGIV